MTIHFITFICNKTERAKRTARTGLCSDKHPDQRTGTAALGWLRGDFVIPLVHAPTKTTWVILDRDYADNALRPPENKVLCDPYWL